MESVKADTKCIEETKCSCLEIVSSDDEDRKIGENIDPKELREFRLDGRKLFVRTELRLYRTSVAGRWIPYVKIENVNDIIEYPHGETMDVSFEFDDEGVTVSFMLCLEKEIELITLTPLSAVRFYSDFPDIGEDEFGSDKGCFLKFMVDYAVGGAKSAEDAVRLDAIGSKGNSRDSLEDAKAKMGVWLDKTDKNYHTVLHMLDAIDLIDPFELKEVKKDEKKNAHEEHRNPMWGIEDYLGNQMYHTWMCAQLSFISFLGWNMSDKNPNLLIHSDEKTFRMYDIEYIVPDGDDGEPDRKIGIIYHATDANAVRFTFTVTDTKKIFASFHQVMWILHYKVCQK